MDTVVSAGEEQGDKGTLLHVHTNPTNKPPPNEKKSTFALAVLSNFLCGPPVHPPRLRGEDKAAGERGELSLEREVGWKANLVAGEITDCTIR
ncbi:hypothetical protein AOLI_G00006240 [Acnodon oligacanthus]